MIHLQVDSALIAKIDKLSQAVETINRKVNINPWIPLAAAVVGGLIVWINQYFERSFKFKQEWKKEINETFAKCEMLLFLVKCNLKEYAAQRTLRMFWHYSHLMELSKANCNAELAKKYYDTCTTCADNALKTNLKLGEIMSEYYSNVSKFKILTDSDINLSPIQLLVTDVTLEDATEINAALSPDEARKAYNLNKENLYKQYLTQFNALDSIDTQISLFCKRINKNSYQYAGR